jgi:hypothetical protein
VFPLQLAAARPGSAACLRNRIRWYSQPIATDIAGLTETALQICVASPPR